jgi:cytochrome b
MNTDHETGAKTRVWDLPTRLFHWALVVLVVLQYLTGEFDLLDLDWHFRFGYATLALVAFRVLWGFVGSQSARISDFVRGPRAVMLHLRALVSGPGPGRAGHNPLGGWSVLVLLGSVLVQAVSGLFSADDLANEGPLAAHVSERTVDFMTHVHHQNQTILLVLVCLHVVAVLLYLLLRRENLILPMLSGRRRLERVVAPRMASPWLALALLAVCAALVAARVWVAG